MSSWKLYAIGGGVSFLLFYAYTVFLYLRGQGRERLENAVKALLILKENGSVLEIVRRGRGVVLLFCRQDGQMNWAVLRLRIPGGPWSLPFCTELKESLGRNGFEFIATEGHGEWIAEVRIPVADIWAVGSAARGAEAANLALDALGYENDARFILKLKGKKNWRLMSRPGSP